MLERLPLLSSGISLRPELACEISPAGVIAARPDGDTLITHFVPLAEGTVVAGTSSLNLHDRPRVVGAIRTAVEAVIDDAKRNNRIQGARELTTIVPDAAVRVFLLDFDTLPSKRVEAIAIIRFRLRKLVSFDAEDSSISYQPVSQTSAQTRVLVTIIPSPVLIEYESVVREAGFHSGVVLPSTLAASTLLSSEPALIINHSGDSLTTAILRGEELLLHRALEFDDNLEAAAATAGRTLPSPASIESTAAIANLPSAIDLKTLRAEDFRQTVSVALAYYEDTLAQSPTELFYIGPGSAHEFAALLGDQLLSPTHPLPGADPTAPLISSPIGVRELLSSSTTILGTAPRALLAPVAGALRN